jgi:hypothetical protein
MSRPLCVAEAGDGAEANGGSVSLSTDHGVCIAWLEGALRRLRPEGQEKVVALITAICPKRFLTS